MNQRRFTYNTCYAIAYYFRCFACRSSKRLKKIKSAKKDCELEKGKEMLSRDLDIVNLLGMIKDYHLMKQVLFTHDDRFLLHLQHRDMICSTSSSSEDYLKELRESSTGNESIARETNQLIKHEHIFDEAHNLDDEQKEFVRNLLQRYEERHVSEKEFRILQGILTTNFSI